MDCCIALAFTRAIFTSFVDTSRGYKGVAYGWSLEDPGGSHWDSLSMSDYTFYNFEPLSQSRGRGVR